MPVATWHIEPLRAINPLKTTWFIQYNQQVEITVKPENFDCAKFSKIYNLMNSTTFDGEREAARDRAEAMACAAGLTFDQAVQIVNEPEAPPAQKNFFEGFADYMEQQEPGYRARCAEEARIRAEENMRQRQELLKRYGSEDAVFAPCDREALLIEACQHLAEIDPESGYVSNLDGWTTLSKDEDLPQSVRDAVSQAFILPKTVAAAWEEWCYWSMRAGERFTFEEYYEDHPAVRARTVVLEELLRTIPAKNLEDVHARLDKYEEICNRGFYVESKEQDAFIKQFRDDIQFLAEGVQVGRQAPFTNAAKRDAVLEYLKCPERSQMSDRQIARAVGVSPQTVNNWRKKLGVQFGRNQ